MSNVKTILKFFSLQSSMISPFIAKMQVQEPNSLSTNSSIFLVTNICNLVSVCLDSANYVLWRFSISPLLKSHNLSKYLDGSVTAPNSLIRAEAQAFRVNPKFEKWYEHDQALIILINATLT